MPQTLNQNSVSEKEATLVTSKDAATTSRKAEENLQPISAKIEKDLYKEVKVYTIKNEIKLSDLIQRALKNYIGLNHSIGS